MRGLECEESQEWNLLLYIISSLYTVLIFRFEWNVRLKIYKGALAIL